MGNAGFRKCVWTTAGLLVGEMALLHGLSHGERIPLRQPLRELPLALSIWQGRDLPIAPPVLAELGADDYLHRLYTNGPNEWVDVYVAYYANQQTDDSIHSPKNCLPGAGWEPVRTGRLKIPARPGPSIVVNEYLVEKGLDKELVLYWYQGRGRVVASEYWGKAWMVVDAATRHRTDGALVRIVTPATDGDEKARERAVKFVRALYPLLAAFIPA